MSFCLRLVLKRFRHWLFLLFLRGVLMYIWGFDTKKGCNSNLKSFSHNFLHYILGYPKYQIVGLELGE